MCPSLTWGTCAVHYLLDLPLVYIPQNDPLVALIFVEHTYVKFVKKKIYPLGDPAQQPDLGAWVGQDKLSWFAYTHAYWNSPCISQHFEHTEIR